MKLLKVWITALLSIVFSINSNFSQDIKTLLDKAKNSKDTNLVHAYHDLGLYYFYKSNIDSLLYFSNLALDASKKIKFTRMDANIYKSMAVAYSLKGETKTSIEFSKKSYESAKLIKDTIVMCKSLMNIGAGYTNIQDNENAIYYTLEAGKLYEKSKDIKGLIFVELATAKIYRNIGQLDKFEAQIHNLNSKINKLSEDQFDLKESIYSLNSEFFLKKTNEDSVYLDSAYTSITKGLELAENFNLVNRKSFYYNALSGYYYQKKDYHLTLEFGKKALDFKKFMDENSILNNLLFAAQANMKLGNKKEALQALDSTKLILSKSENKELNRATYKVYYQVYNHFGEYENALRAYEGFFKINQELFNLESSNIVTELETKYQSEIKDAAITKLNQQKEIDKLIIENKNAAINRLIAIILIAILLLLVILILFRQRSILNKLKINESEQRLNRARINPHFFFNAMTSIQTVAMTENSPKTTVFISKFSKIMRLSLESTYNDLVPIEQEILFLTNYLELQKLRFPDKFNFQFTVDPNITISQQAIPSMILQPFVENSIEHGFMNIDYVGQIDISFAFKDHSLQITVLDNGKFFNNEDKHKEYPSRATEIIKDRLFLLKTQTKKESNFKIEQDPSLKGYKITITLPLLKL